MKTIAILALSMSLIGCDCPCGEGPAESKRTGEKYFPVKVCPIGALDGSGCVEYAAKSYNPSGSDLMIHTLDGHAYRFNNAGWAWVVTTR